MQLRTTKIMAHFAWCFCSIGQMEDKEVSGEKQENIRYQTVTSSVERQTQDVMESDQGCTLELGSGKSSPRRQHTSQGLNEEGKTAGQRTQLCSL